MTSLYNAGFYTSYFSPCFILSILSGMSCLHVAPNTPVSSRAWYLAQSIPCLEFMTLVVIENSVYMVTINVCSVYTLFDSESL